MEIVKVLNIDTEHDSSGTLGEPEGGCSCDSPNLDHLIKLQKDKEFL